MANLKEKKPKSILPSLPDLFESNVFEKSKMSLNGAQNNLACTLPSVNITETNEAFMIDIAAPGMEKKDFKVEVENGTLHIRSEKKQETSEEKKHFWKREFSYTSFNRSFQLPQNSIPEKIGARYENGILMVSLPKKETSMSGNKQTVAVL